MVLRLDHFLEDLPTIIFSLTRFVALSRHHHHFLFSLCWREEKFIGMLCLGLAFVFLILWFVFVFVIVFIFVALLVFVIVFVFVIVLSMSL